MSNDEKVDEQHDDEADNTFAHIMAKAKEYSKHSQHGLSYLGKNETEQAIERIREEHREEKAKERDYKTLTG